MNKYLKLLYYKYVPKNVESAVDSLRYPKRRLSAVVKGPFQERNLIYIHIPKVAGTSLSEAVYGYDIGHHTMEEVHKKIGSKMGNYFKFSFVRDPVTRLSSAFNYFIEMERLYPGSKYSWISRFENFEMFVRNGFTYELVENDRFFWSQSRYLNCCNFRLNFLGRFESIGRDFCNLANKVGVDPASLPHRRKSSRRESSMKISSRDISKIKDIYREDFLNFDYK